MCGVGSRDVIRSYHCLTSYTGKLDAEGFTNTYGDLGDSAHCQRTPVTLVIPVPITSIR